MLWAVGDSCGGIVQEGICQVDEADFPRQPAATMLWRSTDGGHQWSFVSDPMRMPLGLTDRPAGYDVDVAVSQPEHRGEPTLLYVVANWVGSFEVAISDNGGRSWSTSVLGGFVGTGRPWLASSGPCSFYVSFDPVTGDTAEVASVPIVARYNGCAIFRDSLAGQSLALPTQVAMVEPVDNEVTHTDDVFSKIRVIGPDLYQAMVVCDVDPLPDPSCNAQGDRETIEVAESTDGGRSFHDVIIGSGAFGVNLDDGTWPLSLAVDRHGLAVLVADTGYSILTFVSHDQARSWRRIPSVDAGLGWGLAGVASTAATGGTYSVAWYASPPAAPGTEQRWYLATAIVRDGRAPTLRVLPTELATTDHGTPLEDTLSESFGAEIDAGHAIFVYVESCSANPGAGSACPEPSTGIGRMLVVRWAWVR